MDYHSRFSLKHWRWLGWLLSLGALVFVGRWLWQLDRTIWDHLNNLQFAWLILALVVWQFWYLLRYRAWEWISARLGYEQARHVSLRMWAISELLRYIPGNIWSFAARYRGLREGGTNRGAALQTLLIEAVGLVTSAMTISCIVAWQLIWLLGIPLIAGVTIFILPRFIPLIWRKLRPHEPVPNIQPSDMAMIMAWYLLGWLIFGLGSAFVYLAFGAAVPWVNLWPLIWVSVAAWLIGYISIVTPMGLGVREVGFVGLISHWVSVGVGSLVAVTSRLWLVVSELVFLGLVMIISHRRS